MSFNDGTYGDIGTTNTLTQAASNQSSPFAGWAVCDQEDPKSSPIFHLEENQPPTSNTPHSKTNPVVTMPTPESEAFLARKPTVPPTFDGVNMLDTKAVFDARDAIIREQWVKQMMARLVRDELGTC